LKQSLWDFERLGTCFSKKHWANDGAVGILFRVVLALSFQIRSGKLKEEQLAEVQVNRYARIRSAKSDSTPGVADELEKRYPGTSFDQTILPSELLKTFFFGGWVAKDAIRAALDQSPYYALPGSEPAWKTAWHFWDLDDTTFEEAVANVEEQFHRRAFVVPGEMLHVFGLRLLFSEINAIAASRADVVQQCKRYVDCLRKDRKILNAYTNQIKLDGSQGWAGLVVVDVNTAEFQDVLKYYYDIVDAVAIEGLPGAARDLLTTLKNSPDEYFRTLCINNFAPSIYYDVPVLAAIPVDDFVTLVMSLNPKSQRIAFTVFKARYEIGLLGSKLANEKAWLGEVKRGFEEKAKSLRPLSKFRVLNYVRRNIDPYV
jgi:hypothetical protein